MSVIAAQLSAITYLKTREKHGIRVKRKAGSIVRSACERAEYTEAQADACVKDMFDMFRLLEAASDD